MHSGMPFPKVTCIQSTFIILLILLLFLREFLHKEYKFVKSIILCWIRPIIVVWHKLLIQVSGCKWRILCQNKNDWFSLTVNDISPRTRTWKHHGDLLDVDTINHDLSIFVRTSQILSQKGPLVYYDEPINEGPILYQEPKKLSKDFNYIEGFAPSNAI